MVGNKRCQDGTSRPILIMNKYILILTVLLVCGSLRAQVYSVDSILRVAQSAVDSVSQVEENKKAEQLKIPDFSAPPRSRKSNTTTYRELDDDYLKEVENIIRQEELKKSVGTVMTLYKLRRYQEERKFHYDGIAYLIRGTYTTFTEKHFRDKEGLFRTSGSNLGEYGVAVVPLGASWAMRMAGVKAKSNTERMLTANAIALALSSGLTFGLKSAVNEKRPDGGKHSLPSGHCSLAFASAAILDREYGYLSPWVTIGSYSFATATQFLRYQHNRHWINDTFMGAGIGMMATNLAYFITDQMMKGKGIRQEELTQAELLRNYHFIQQPSTFTLLTAMETGHTDIPSSSYTLPADFNGTVNFSTGATFSAGMEGSYFFNKHVGVEAMARMSSAQAKVSAVSLTSEVAELSGFNLDFYHLDAGLKLSANPIPSVRFGARVYAGGRFFVSENVADIKMDRTFLSFPSEQCAEVGGGISIDMVRPTSKCLLGIYCDYNHSFSDLFTNRWVIGTTWRAVF